MPIIKDPALKKDEATEELIKSTAERLFFREGRFNATTQEIADAAGVNRTLINYYFRSKDNLLNQIFEEAKIKEIKKSKDVLSSDLPFREKIEKFINFSTEEGIKYPYMDVYLVSQFNKKKCLPKIPKKYDINDEVLPNFYAEYKEEVKKGTVDDMEPLQFVLNILSLASFPASMRPLIQERMNINDEEYERILEDRKQIILNMIFKK
ncbi:MAG: TetR/AcrR family transcriptional regulator [Flavobacteriaceae bacterium]|jgi:AcrR family transcriptional regulator|nr:TetR/AcrR family transcriptional regulator [Flavobacteriaceae bacterium]